MNLSTLKEFKFLRRLTAMTEFFVFPSSAKIFMLKTNICSHSATDNFRKSASENGLLSMGNSISSLLFSNHAFCIFIKQHCNSPMTFLNNKSCHAIQHSRFEFNIIISIAYKNQDESANCWFSSGKSNLIRKKVGSGELIVSPVF